MHTVFSNVAKSYDNMNDAMSFGIHRIWKDALIRELNPGKDVSLLDVAGGTGTELFVDQILMCKFTTFVHVYIRKYFAGDIAFRFLKYKDCLSVGHSRSVTVCDINQNMLDVGTERAKYNDLSDHNISWVCGDAENLPFDDNTFCAYTIAFGIRNCTHINKVL